MNSISWNVLRTGNGKSSVLKCWLVKKWLQVGWVRSSTATNELERAILPCQKPQTIAGFWCPGWRVNNSCSSHSEGCIFSWVEIRSRIAEKGASPSSHSRWMTAASVHIHGTWDTLNARAWGQYCTVADQARSNFVCTYLQSSICVWGTLGTDGHSGSVVRRSSQDWPLSCRQKSPRLSQCHRSAPDAETQCLKVIIGSGVVEQMPVPAASVPASVRRVELVRWSWYTLGEFSPSLQDPASFQQWTRIEPCKDSKS